MDAVKYFVADVYLVEGVKLFKHVEVMASDEQDAQELLEEDYPVEYYHVCNVRRVE